MDVPANANLSASGSDQLRTLPPGCALGGDSPTGEVVRPTLSEPLFRKRHYSEASVAARRFCSSKTGLI